MKKCFLCILLALSLCLAACGGESGTSAAPTHVFTESVESVTEHVAAFLASDYASGITGECVFVDNGFNSVAI